MYEGSPVSRKLIWRNLHHGHHVSVSSTIVKCVFDSKRSAALRLPQITPKQLEQTALLLTGATHV